MNKLLPWIIHTRRGQVGAQEFHTYQAIMRYPNHPVTILGQKWLGRGWDFILADGNEVNLHCTQNLSEDHCNFKTENNNKITMDGLNSRMEMTEKTVNDLEDGMIEMI